MFFTDGDDDNATTQNGDEQVVGPETGDYTPPKDLPIPGETEGMDDSQLG